MKHSKKNIITSVSRTPLLSTDYFYIFKEDHTLEKRALGGQFIWSIAANYGLSILERIDEIILYEYSTLLIIDKQSGKLLRETNLPFLPISIRGGIIYGEAEIDSIKYFAKYSIIKNNLSTVFSFEQGQYCRFTHQSFAVLGESLMNKKITIRSFDLGDTIWEYGLPEEDLSIRVLFYNDVVVIRTSNGHSTFKLKTGELIWQIPYPINAFDDKKGLVYILSGNYLVLDASSGNELIKVENWIENQIEQYPALARMQGVPYISEDYLVFVGRTLTGDEGGVFFMDKKTAEIKDYFRIVYDKDPFQRKDWYGNKIPDDQQIPFIPIDNPIYKDGRLYVTLLSPVEGQKDLYIYERVK